MWRPRYGTKSAGFKEAGIDSGRPARGIELAAWRFGNAADALAACRPDEAATALAARRPGEAATALAARHARDAGQADADMAQQTTTWVGVVIIWVGVVIIWPMFDVQGVDAKDHNTN